MLYLHDLAANAFVELNEFYDLKEIPISVIEKYGEEVVRKLEEYGNNNYSLCSSEQYMNHFENAYGRYFSLRKESDEIIISLNKEISITEIKRRFIVYLPYELLMAFTDQHVVENSLLENLSLEKNKIKQKKLVNVG